MLTVPVWSSSASSNVKCVHDSHAYREMKRTSNCITAVCHYLVFSALIPIPYLAVPSGRFTRLTGSSSSPAKPSMSPANRRLVMVRPPMLTVSVWSSSASSNVN